MKLGHTGTLVLQSRTLKNYNLKTFIESIQNYHACISVIYVHLKYMGRQLAMPKMNYLPLYILRALGLHLFSIGKMSTEICFCTVQYVHSHETQVMN